MTGRARSAGVVGMNWRARYRAANVTFPSWARDEPSRCVYGSNASGKWEAYTWDLSTGERRQITDRPEGTTGALLDPSGRFVWWFDDARGNELGVWMRQPFSGGEASPAVNLAPTYRAGIAVAADFAVVGTSVRGAHRIFVCRDGDSDVLFESDKAAGVGSLSRDETLVAITHCEQTGDSRNRAARVIDLHGRAVAEVWDGPGRGVQPGGWSRVPGDQRLVITHERTGVRRPAVWSPLTGELRDVDADLDGELSASWYPDGGALLVTRLVRGRTELYRYDLSSSALAAIEIEPGMVSAARIRPDGELWYAITTAARPVEVRAAGEVVLKVDAPHGVSYEDVDVGDVHALLARPPGGGPHPTVFQVHGGPSGMDAHSFSPPVQSWVDHGFAVVMVNYRGSSGYGKAWRDAIVGRPGFKEMEDIVAVKGALVARGVIDPSRLVLAGGSWGGYLTLFGVGTRPESWSLGISGVPLADLPAHYHEQAEPLRVYAHALFGGSPESMPVTFRDCSPLTYAERVRVPVMILAGENDPRCPIGQVNNYVRRLEELGKEHQVYRYDAGHGSLVVEEQIHQQELRLSFAAKHLGTLMPTSE